MCVLVCSGGRSRRWDEVEVCKRPPQASKWALGRREEEGRWSVEFCCRVETEERTVSRRSGRIDGTARNRHRDER